MKLNTLSPFYFLSNPLISSLPLFYRFLLPYLFSTYILHHFSRFLSWRMSSTLKQDRRWISYDSIWNLCSQSYFRWTSTISIGLSLLLDLPNSLQQTYNIISTRNGRHKLNSFFGFLFNYFLHLQTKNTILR